VTAVLDLVNIIYVPESGRIVGRWRRDPAITIQLADRRGGTPPDRILAARDSAGPTYLDGLGPRGPLYEPL